MYKSPHAPESNLTRPSKNFRPPTLFRTHFQHVTTMTSRPATNVLLVKRRRSIQTVISHRTIATDLLLPYGSHRTIAPTTTSSTKSSVIGGPSFRHQIDQHLSRDPPEMNDETTVEGGGLTEPLIINDDNENSSEGSTSHHHV